MPAPKAPSVIQTIKCPAFAITWLGPTHYDGRSIIAYGGGGGSARTGVSNTIIILAMSPNPTSTSTSNHNNSNDKNKNSKDSDNNNNNNVTTILNTISTGEQICVGLDMYHYEPQLKDKLLLAAVGNEMRLYDALSGNLMASYDLKGHDGVNAVAFAQNGLRCVAGCENGKVFLFQIIPPSASSPSDPNAERSSSSNNNGNSNGNNNSNNGGNGNIQIQLISSYNGHFESNSNKKGICSVNFSPHHQFFVSSARDGTARVCDANTGAPLAVLQCSITDPNQPPPAKNAKTAKNARPQPILVRGCTFGPDERFIITCQSGRKGPAYCSIWQLQQPPAPPPPQQQQSNNNNVNNNNNHQNQPPMTSLKYVEVMRQCVSPKPVSSMAISGDKTILALGTVEGSVFLYVAGNLSLKKKFDEVHDLPVTCIAACPMYMNMNESIFGVVSASADNKLAFLSVQKPKRKSGGGIWVWFLYLLILWMMGELCRIWYNECVDEFLKGGAMSSSEGLTGCMRDSVLAPPSRPGISFVPH